MLVSKWQKHLWAHRSWITFGVSENLSDLQGPLHCWLHPQKMVIFFLYQVNDKKWWLLFLCEQWGRFIIRTWVNLLKLYVLSRIILPICEKPLSQLGTRQPLKNYIGANCSLLCLPFRKRLLWDSEISTSMNRMLHLTFPWKMCGKSTSSL